MTSLRVVRPGWGYPLVFGALTIPAISAAAQQPDGGLRSLVIGAVVAFLLFGWWRRGVWFANDEYLVVVNLVKRHVVPVSGAELELVPLGSAEVSVDDFDPRRVRTLYLVAESGARTRVRVVDGASGVRIQRAVEAITTVLEVANPPRGSKGRRGS